MSHTSSITVAALQPFTRALAGLPEAERARVVAHTKELLAKAKLSTLDLIDPEARIPLALASEMLQAAEAATGPGLGLRAAERAEVGDLGIFEYVSRSCATLGECIEAVCRYRRLMYDGALLELVTTGDRAKVRYVLQDRIATPITFVEFALAACVIASRRALGFDGSPKVVRFMHGEPSYVRDYARIFRAPLEFGAPYNEIELGKRALDFPLVTADRAMLAILRRYADRLLDELPTALPTARAVQALLRKRMDEGDASFDEIAGALHMSERTLRRRLTEEGVQLRSLIEETRVEQACRYLVSSSLSVSEIAYRVGFSHPPAFHRAFRRAVGQSPLHYRRARAQSAVYEYLTPTEDAASRSLLPRDVGDHIADRAHLLGDLVGDVDAELTLEGEHDLDHGERVGA